MAENSKEEVEEPPNEQILVIKAESAGYNAGHYAKIQINNEAINLEPNWNGHYRGLHLVIINSLSRKIELAQVFDTYKSSKKLDEFLKIAIPKTFIIVAACKDECSTRLSLKVKRWFQ